MAQHVRTLLTLALAAPLLAACAAVGVYYAEADAPDFVKAGGTDPTLALTRAVGRPLSPVVRNLRAPHGRLFHSDGLEAHLRSSLKPLDLILIRSRRAATRLLIPSYFTHAMVWLGSEAEMRRLGVWNLPEVGPQRSSIRAGRSVLESAKDAVRLSPFSEIVDVNEIVVIGVKRRGRAWARKKYAALFARLGRPFDYNFDHSDGNRLTCAELVAEVYPEFGIPVRYATGRYAVIPDDIVRLAVEGSPHLSFRQHVYPANRAGFETGTRETAAARLSEPRVPGS